MKCRPIGSLNRKGHPAHFLTFPVNGRITNGLLLCHGDLPPGGVLAIVESEAKGCCDVIWGVTVAGRLNGTWPVPTYCCACDINIGSGSSILVPSDAGTTPTWVFAGSVGSSYSSGETEVNGAGCGGWRTLLAFAPFCPAASRLTLAVETSWWFVSALVSVRHFRKVGSTLAFCAAATVCEHTSGLNLNIRHVHIIWPSSVRVTELGYCVDRLWTEYLMTYSSSDGIWMTVFGMVVYSDTLALYLECVKALSIRHRESWCWYSTCYSLTFRDF